MWHKASAPPQLLTRADDEPAHTGEVIDNRHAQLPTGRGVLIGCAQILALLPGISRSGITMVAGLRRGPLNTRDQPPAEFSDQKVSGLTRALHSEAWALTTTSSRYVGRVRKAHT